MSGRSTPFSFCVDYMYILSIISDQFMYTFSVGGFLKTWVPFLLLVGAILTVILTLYLR